MIEQPSPPQWTTADVMAPWYETRHSDGVAFGDKYRAPPRIEYGVETVVAYYPKASGDGQPVEILECRMPARFYRLRALPSTNSGGDPIPGFELSTGSGDEVAKLVATLAQAITEGMLGLYTGPEAKT